MILLDTHTLVWLDEGNKKLGKKSRARIDQSLKSDELYVSAISFWEVAMLIEKGRLNMQINVGLWRRNLLDNGLKESPISGEIAINSASLNNFHGDPADRMIVATAISLSSILCTADKKILSWKSDCLRLDAGT